MTQMIQPVSTAPVIKENTHIYFILDRSGSMNRIKGDTIGGFNSYVEDQKGDEGRTRFTLVQFDDLYEVNYTGVDINDVPVLNEESFVPRGWTALYDAVGLTIARALGEPDDPTEQKIFVVLTDGDENESKEHTYQSVQNLIAEAQDRRGWEVLFIGAGLNAKSVASSMGIKASNSFSYGDANGQATSKGISDAMFSAAVGSTLNRAKSRGVDIVSATTAVFGGAAAACGGDLDMTSVYAAVSKGAPDLKERLKSFKENKKADDTK